MKQTGFFSLPSLTYRAKNCYNPELVLVRPNQQGQLQQIRAEPHPSWPDWSHPRGILAQSFTKRSYQRTQASQKESNTHSFVLCQITSLDNNYGSLVFWISSS